ncbi:MAG: hypothetical protein HY273_07900 [Gammaproteobacteria bacterium]|nr:hypothetical protein [Gammaproteobacteria bacterium]
MWHNLTVLIFAALYVAASTAYAADDGRDAGGRATQGAVAEMDHSHMDHGAMERSAAEPVPMDHSKMDAPTPMDHSKMNMDEPAPMDHSKMNMEEAAPLPMLATPPASCKAREAGFDGTELMESTSADASLAVQCAQASRCLIVVDRATWAQCTGKPATPDVPAAKAPEHQGH